MTTSSIIRTRHRVSGINGSMGNRGGPGTLGMRGEDSHDRMMRLLHEHQNRLIERISRGNASAESVAGGYMHVAGQVVGLDAAIEIVRSCLFGDAVPEARESVVDAYDT